MKTLQKSTEVEMGPNNEIVSTSVFYFVEISGVTYMASEWQLPLLKLLNLFDVI